MSSTKERRQAFDYRTEYFKHNKGVLGFYFCAQCFKPLRKEDVEVDHIVPLSKMGPNSVINCVATCRHCNRSKSDIIDGRVIKGVIFKIVEEICIFFSRTFGYLGREVFKSLMDPVKDNAKIKLGILILLYFLLMSILFK